MKQQILKLSKSERKETLLEKDQRQIKLKTRDHQQIKQRILKIRENTYKTKA